MSRQTAREALAALFVTAGGFNVVNAFLPLELGGATKILNIFSRVSRTDRPTKHNIHNLYTLNLDALVLRGGTAADEDDLDTLHEIIVTVCLANPATANWSHLQLDAETEPRFVEAEGNQYRMERHRVMLNVKS
jgi:hypothetical protein